MRKMRVATLFTRLHIGGDENRVLTFARHFDRARFSHQVIVMVTPDEALDHKHGPMAHRYAELGVPTHFLGELPRGAERSLPAPVAAARDARRLVRVCGRVAAHLRAEGIDLVDARMASSIPVGLVAARMAGAAVVATEYFDGFWERSPWRELGPHIFAGLDALICDSEACLDALKAWAPGLKRGMVIRNGIDVPRAERTRAQMRAVLNVPEGARLLAQISRLVPYKGHEVLLRAAAPVMAKHPDVHLLLCGYAGRGQAYVDGLWALANQLGIQTRVRITGYPGQIADVWAAVDVHVHASELDSAPIAIHEGMALGRPAVVSTAGGIPELVEDGQTALLVQAGQWQPLAEAILKILEDPILSQRLGEGARRRYQALHLPERMAASHEALFEEVVSLRRAQAGTPVSWRGSHARL